jgi:hypothetical protein
MKLPVDTSAIAFLCAVEAEPVVDFETRRPKADENGAVADRGRPVAWCSEWHGDGTADEHDRASHLMVEAQAWPMGEAGPRRPLASLAGVRGCGCSLQ